MRLKIAFLQLFPELNIEDNEEQCSEIFGEYINLIDDGINVLAKKLQRGKVISEVEWKITPLLYCKGVQKIGGEIVYIMI